jgi:hypothetical protein
MVVLDGIKRLLLLVLVVMSSTRIKPTVPFSLGIPTLQYQNLSDFFGRKERQGTFTYQPPSTRHLAEGLLEYLFQRRPDRLVPIYEGGTVPILGYGYHSKLLGTFHSLDVKLDWKNREHSLEPRRRRKFLGTILLTDWF